VIREFNPCEHLGFISIGRRKCRVCEQVFVDVLGVGSEQTVACGGDHHGIDDHRHVEVVDVLRDDRDNGRSCEHPSLYRTDVKVG